MGKLVRIKRGKMKSCRGTVVEVQTGRAKVELQAKMKSLWFKREGMFITYFILYSV